MDQRDGAAWGKVRAGRRPSSLLMVGAAVMALGPILDQVEFLGMLPWYAWLTGLTLIGVALVMCTPRGWSSAMVTVAGLIFLAHAGTLAVALLGVATAAFVYQLLAVPKVLALGLLAMTERRQHGQHRMQWMLVASVLAAAKIGWRAVAPEMPWRDQADLVVNLVVAFALVMFARGLRRREDEWAHRRLVEISASFEDFDPNRPRKPI